MRKDEQGNPCPETLGEYLQALENIGAANSKAANFIKEKIESSPDGMEEKVIVHDSQMRHLLFSML